MRTTLRTPFAALVRVASRLAHRSRTTRNLLEVAPIDRDLIAVLHVRPSRLLPTHLILVRWTEPLHCSSTGRHRDIVARQLRGLAREDVEQGDHDAAIERSGRIVLDEAGAEGGAGGHLIREDARLEEVLQSLPPSSCDLPGRVASVLYRAPPALQSNTRFREHISKLQGEQKRKQTGRPQLIVHPYRRAKDVRCPPAFNCRLVVQRLPQHGLVLQ